MSSHLGDSYFLVTNSNQSGSPPQRAPPLFKVDRSSSSAPQSSSHRDVSGLENTSAVKQSGESSITLDTCPEKIPVIGLPILKSGTNWVKCSCLNDLTYYLHFVFN